MKRVALASVVLYLLFAPVEGLCQKMPTRDWLPDAPSSDVEHPPLMLGTSGINGITPGSRPSFVEVTPMNSGTFFDKYLYPSLLKRNSHYRAATGGSFLRRATEAASRLLITRDESGKDRLNDSYFSGMLTSVVVQTAYTPYWTRSTSTPFNNLGSTLGSDVGFNVFHEFEPDIRQLIMAHTPRFVSRIEDSIIQGR